MQSQENKWIGIGTHSQLDVTQPVDSRRLIRNCFTRINKTRTLSVTLTVLIEPTTIAALRLEVTRI